MTDDETRCAEGQHNRVSGKTADPPADARALAPPPPAKQRTRERKGPSSTTYRLLCAEIDRQRRALGWSLAQLDDAAGLQDGHSGKLLSPDSPSGRQGTYYTIDLLAQALERAGRPITFGDAAGIHSTPCTIREVLHWRSRRHFQQLGAKGFAARRVKHDDATRSEWARRAANARWSKRDRAQA